MMVHCLVCASTVVARMSSSLSQALEPLGNLTILQAVASLVAVVSAFVYMPKLFRFLDG